VSNIKKPKDLESTGGECVHGIPVGNKCPRCGGIVGGKGPKKIRPGQLWAARGGEHVRCAVIEVSESRILLEAQAGKPRLIAFAFEENLRDEFYYVGERPGWEQIARAAQAHDVESPEMGFGDLEIALSVAWNIMTEAQQARFMRDEQVRAVLAWGDNEDEDD
jgi:hypothetical protein